MAKKCRLAFLGFGNAARAFSQLLLDKASVLESTKGMDVQIVGISTRSRRTLYQPEGISLADLLEYDYTSKGWPEGLPNQGAEWSPMEMVEKADYDLLFEMTPLDIFSGQPAIQHVEKALLRGKDVITANKGPIAWDFSRLRNLAVEKGCRFYYETTVMDGTPVFNLVEKTLAFCQVTEVEGILNSTTNYVLEELGSGKNYQEILAEGKARGFMEEDSSLDLEGWDAAAKVSALLNVLMDAQINPLQIERQGILGITPEQIREAKKHNQVFKLICSGWREGKQVRGRVKPILVPKDSIYGSIHGTSSMVSISTDLMGKLSIVEHNPEILQTGYGLFSDLLRVLDDEREWL
jgi:homoserine dehydrogenase